MIETDGYVAVFNLCAALGAIAVVFCILEWIRAERARRREIAHPELVPPSDAARAAEGDTAA